MADDAKVFRPGDHVTIPGEVVEIDPHDGMPLVRFTALGCRVHNMWFKHAEVQPHGSWDDKPLPEDVAIDEAFPTRSGRHDLYGEANRLVSASHSKFRLIEVMNWLLHCADNVRRASTSTIETMQSQINNLTRERDDARALVETWKANDVEYERLYREAKAKLEGAHEKGEGT